MTTCSTRRRRVQPTVMGFLLVGLAAAPVAAETEFPLPRGAVMRPEPTQVELGSTTLEVRSFVTSMDEKALNAFYRKALPRGGWTLASLPWQAQHAKATERLEKTLKFRRDVPEQARDTLKQRLTEFQETSQAMQQQLYATRGAEHVIVNLWPMGEAGVAVFINRWTGGRSWMEDQGRQERWTAPSGEWPLTNVCCSTEEVADLKGPLPSFIPRYPNARAVGRSTSGHGTNTTMLLMAPASAEDVLAYYRQAMSAEGWELIGEQGGATGSDASAQILTYKKPGRQCVLTIQGPSGQADQGDQTLVTIAIGPRPSGRTPL